MAGGSQIHRVAGRAVALGGNDIDTDRVMPARFLKAVTFDGLEAHLFADDRAQATAAGAVHPFDDPARAGAAVLLVNGNFGCGSSREHAPQAIRRWGIQAVVGESFADIFFSNALALGLPCLVVSADDVAALMAVAAADPAAEFSVDIPTGRIDAPGTTAQASLPDAARRSLLSGDWDATSRLVADGADVARVAASIPYLNGFQPRD